MESLDPSTFKEFENAAAGHAGVMSDASGELFIKPCTQAEIDFYQDTMIHHPDVYDFMPTFMGSLRQSDSVPTDLAAQEAALRNSAGITSGNAMKDNQNSSAPDAQQQLGPPTTATYGKKLQAGSALVLENLEHGFTRPNVLDIKLGARLYGDGTDPAKIARLDKVAAETTSGSLNFRIAGMRVWDGAQFEIFDKFYGRAFTAETVRAGFAKFFSGLQTGAQDSDQAKRVMEVLCQEVGLLRELLESCESRMYGASILLIYEGDHQTLAANTSALLQQASSTAQIPSLQSSTALPQERMSLYQDDTATATSSEAIDDIDDDDDEEQEDSGPVICRVKLIDFAHSAWTPGLGPDENLLKGCRNVEQQLACLLQQM